MQPLVEAAGWLFGWLLRNSAHATILVVVIWGLERTIGPYLPPRWRYGLWLVFVARLLLPVAPESPFSLFNLIDLAPASVSGAALQVLGLPPPVVGPTVAAVDPLADTPPWFVLALALWLPGAVTLAVFVWRDQRRLAQALSSTSPVLDAEILDLLRQGKAVMSVRRRVAVVETSQIKSPAISGWLRPRLLLPAGLLARLNPDEIRFLFLHELAHVKRSDLAFNWLLAVIQILHWFNPIVWLALRRLLAVREEVCDDLVLRRCFRGAAREYGLTLLRILEECAPRRVLPSLAGVLDDVRALRQRIRCIRNFGMFEPNPFVPAGLTIAVAIIGLTERMREPVLRGGPSAAASDVAALATRPPSNGSRSSASLRSSPREPVEPEGRRSDAVNRVVSTLTAALQQAVSETRPREIRPGGPAGPSVREPSGSPSMNRALTSSGNLGATGVPTSRTTVTQPRPGTRPYPLPPVSERGDIIRPRRPAGDPAAFDGSASRALLEAGSNPGRHTVIPKPSDGRQEG